MRVTFRELKRRASKLVACAVCGAKVKRQRTFMQTLNPWNKNADGTVRSPEDIWRALDTEAGEWAVQPETCRKCESNQ